jgi:DivIVA domain-containing protein
VFAFLLSVAGVLVIGGLLFLGGSLLLGRGETQPPAEQDRSPVELPDDRPVTGADVRGLRISVALRGYRMTEVDWLLDQFAQTLDERDQEIAGLRARLDRAERGPAPAPPPAGERPHEQHQLDAEPHHSTEQDGARSDA